MKATKFKPSEIGPIPEEWEVKRLGDVWSSFRTGPFGSSLHAQDYVCNGTPLINPMHIVNGSIVPSAEMSVDSVTADRLAAYKLSVNDIVIGRRGEMGRAAIVHDRETGWLCGTGCFYFHLKEMVSPEFVVRYLRTPACVSVLEGEAVGTTLVNLNQTILGRVNIPVPPRAEQEKIAAALSDVDELLAAMATLIEKKRAIKQGAMQELLDVRPTALTQRTQNAQRGAKCFSHGERGEHGEEKTYAPRRRLAGFAGPWVERRLGDVLSIGNGKDYKHLPSGDVPVYGTGGLMTYVNASLHDGPTVCIGRKGTIDEPQYHEGKIWTVDTLFYTYDFEGVNPKFLYYLFTRIDWQSYNTATGVPSLTAKAICDIEVYFPTLAEQKSIAGVLADMDAEIAALESKRAKYEQIKQGMMLELLTGKTRLEA